MQKSLSFNKGITTSPSDLLSDDTELSASRDLIFRNGEIQPLRQANQLGSLAHKLLYIHKGADYTNAITYDEHTYYLYWGTISGDTITEDTGSLFVGKVYDITSVGNTLVVATDNGLHYILYKNGEYVSLGTELPKYRFTPRIYAITNLGLGGTKCVLDEMVEGVAYLAHYKDGKFTGCEQKFAASTPSGDTFFIITVLNQKEKKIYKQPFRDMSQHVLPKLKKTIFLLSHSSYVVPCCFTMAHIHALLFPSLVIPQ